MSSLPLLLLLSALYIYRLSSFYILYITYVISIIYIIYYNLCRTSSAPIDPAWLYMSSLPLLLLLSALYILYVIQLYCFYYNHHHIYHIILIHVVAYLNCSCSSCLHYIYIYIDCLHFIYYI